MSEPLYELWAAVLQGDDLRPWIRRALPQLADVVPGGNAAPADIADRLVEAIVQRGLVPESLSALAAKFPGRHEQIEGVARALQVVLVSPAGSPPVQAPGRPLWPRFVLAAAAGVVALSLTLPQLRGCGATPSVSHGDPTLATKPETPPAPQDLRDVFARLLRSEPDQLHLNIPPLPAREIGTILARAPDGRQMLAERLRFEDLETSVGPAVSAAAGPIVASRELMNSLGVDATDTELAAAEVEIRLGELTVREALGAALRKRIEENDNVREQRRRGARLVVITKTFEAIPELAFRPRLTGDPAWAALRRRLQASRAVDETSEGPGIVLKGDTSSVLAYEVSSVEFVADSLGDATKVRLLPVSVDDPGEPLPAVSTQTLGRFEFAVLAGSRYRLHGSLPGTSDAALVGQTLRGAGGEPLVELAPEELTTEVFRSALARIVDGARTTQPPLLVVYYFGHAMPLGLGQQVLIMSDYAGDLKQDAVSVGRVAHDLTGPAHPLHGSNMDDLLRVAQAVETTQVRELPGLVTVAEVHQLLQTSGVPFVLLIDGCYQDEEFEAIRDLLQLTEIGDYYGDADGATAERDFHAKILRYGDIPALRGTDPVILAARPGQTARLVHDPRHAWSLAPGVGPLARRLYLGIDGASSWPGLLRSMIDIQPTGEVRIAGTISWSDIAGFERRVRTDAAPAER